MSRSDGRSVIVLRQDIYINRCLYSSDRIYQFSRHFDRLVVWPWPTIKPERVTPDNMRHYRSTNRMLGPCCLCPLIDPTGPDFMESAMYHATTGTHAGEYVASCAKDKCGYLVPMERIYTRPGLYIKDYPARVFGEQVPALVTHISEGFLSHTEPHNPAPRRPLKRTYAMLVPDVTANDVQEQRPLQRIATNGRSGSSQLLAKLDSATGITSQEFQGLFAKCDLCKCVMMHRTFAAHNCSVIDLTGDTETEE